MYSTIIELKKDISPDLLSQLKENIEAAFSNRVGTVKNISKEPYRFEFVGGEDEYGCLDIGSLILKKDEFFRKYVQKWNWVEDNPNECCDILKIYSTPVKHYGK